MKQFILRSLRMTAMIVCPMVLLGCQDWTPHRDEGCVKYYPFTTGCAEFATDENAPIVDLEVEFPQIANAGSEIPVRVTLTNPGGTAVSFLVDSDLPRDVLLTLPDGTQATLTSYGEAHFGHGRSINSVTTLTLEGGASRVWNFDLRKIYEINKPGFYSLSVSQDLNYWNSTAKQNTVIAVKHLRFTAGN